MKTKIRLFLMGLVLGALATFPLGVNIGRGNALLSNPLADRDLQHQVVAGVRDGTETALVGVRETIHEATRPTAPAE